MSAGRPRGRSDSASPRSARSSSSTDRRPRRPPRQFAAEEPINTTPSGFTSKIGGFGTAVRLYTNHFKLETPTDAILYDYHVTFDPVVEYARNRRHLIYQHREIFNSAYIFDGGANIKSLALIEETITCDSVSQLNNEKFRLTIKKIGVITWQHPEMMRFYNTQMRRNLTNIGFTQLGRDFFDKAASISMREYRVEVWPGMLTAINEHDGGILMATNRLNKIIRNETAHDLLKKLHRESRREEFMSRARRELSGSIVMSRYNNKTYRIDDVIFDKNPVTYEFERRGETITLKDYFESQYGQKINDDKQPLLLVRPTDQQRRGGIKKDIILIPELSVLTGVTETLKNNLDFRRELDRHVRLGPVERMRSLEQFVQRLNSNETVNSEMNQWGLNLDPDMVRLTGRLLPAEKILVSDLRIEDGISYNQQSGLFESEIRSEKMRSAVAIERWVIVALIRDKNVILTYLDSLRRVSSPLGVQIFPPKFFWVEDDRTSTYIDKCRSIPPEAKMVHVIVPNNNRDRYSTIKRFFCCEFACPSQVLTTRVLNKNQLSIATKLIIQMSAKMGGQPWALDIPPKNTMIVGYNVYRDTSKRGSTVGAFVSSTNSQVTSWFSRASYHKTYEEMSCNFAASLKLGIQSWYQLNHRFPERIIIYRDGVSEGQIGYIFKNEIAKITEILGEREELRESTWCFIIVNKRVNARFFLKANPTDPVKNPIAGTVIDTVVTRPERYDFYLISQSVRFGTVNPTIYNIIKDNTKWQAKHHQTLAYKLCHLYYNWAGTISVPAPCHYAYKLAFLVGTCIHQEPFPGLGNQLYFL